MLLGELEPTGGQVVRASGARVALVNQHSADQLDLGLSPLEFMLDQFPAPASEQKLALSFFLVLYRLRLYPVCARVWRREVQVFFLLRCTPPSYRASS